MNRKVGICPYCREVAVLDWHNCARRSNGVDVSNTFPQPLGDGITSRSHIFPIIPERARVQAMAIQWQEFVREWKAKEP